MVDGGIKGSALDRGHSKRSSLSDGQTSELYSIWEASLLHSLDYLAPKSPPAARGCLKIKKASDEESRDSRLKMKWSVETRTYIFTVNPNSLLSLIFVTHRKCDFLFHSRVAVFFALRTWLLWLLECKEDSVPGYSHAHLSCLRQLSVIGEEGSELLSF